MDPDATWKGILTILGEGQLTQGDWARVSERCAELKEWINKGGFLPDAGPHVNRRSFLKILIGIAAVAERNRWRCRYCGFLVDTDGLCTRKGCAGQT